jgi:hypothetical protein
MFSTLNKSLSDYGPGTIRFKTMKRLIGEYKLCEEWYDNITLNGYTAYYITSDMQKRIMTGKPLTFISMCDKGGGWLRIDFPPTYHIHRDWIDNSPRIEYNDIDKLFREPL